MATCTVPCTLGRMPKPSAVRVSCDSVVERVVVYPRGALVSRAVRVPDGLAAERCELLLTGLPGEVRPASVRVHANGKRRVNATRARLVTPDAARARTEAKVERAELLKRLRAIELSLEQGEATRRALGDATSFENLPGDRRFLLDPAAYVAQGLGLTQLFDDLSRETDQALQGWVRELAEVRARLLSLDVAEQAAPSPHETEPHLEVRIELGPGEGHPELTVEYVVWSARYWPAYTVRFTERGTRALLSFEPFVAQTSGEDWTDVRLSIATGDLVSDAALPKLPSLRYGRAQVVKPLGYRPLPSDNARLFEGFDTEWKRGRQANVTPPKKAPPPRSHPDEGSVTRAGTVDARALLASLDVDEGMAMPLGGAPPPGFAAQSSSLALPAEADMPLPAPRAKGGLFSGFGGGSGGSSPAPARSTAPAPVSIGGEAEELARRSRHGAAHGAEPASPPPKALAPVDELLDFDGLVLPPPQSADRGRLVVQTPSLGEVGQRLRGEFQAMSPPPGVRDPEHGGALFDHVFHGTTTCRVPSSARPVRVAVDRREARATPRLTVVPRESAEVFREADVDNPFEGPLLPGPIDVLLDGSLVTETVLPLVDRGAKARVGMGVEDRVKVARNARVEEKSAGLLGGQRAVDHAITIDVVSALPFTSYLEIRDRMPFADEHSGVEAKLVAASPAPSSKDVSGTGHKLRGGLLWHLELGAGGTARVSFGYRLSLSAKDEIVGGNRRD